MLTDLLTHDNATRGRAEAELNSKRDADPAGLMQLFVANLKNENVEVAQIACVLFKKYFLDAQQGVKPEDLEVMRAAVMESVDFAQPILLLKRKGDIIAKVYHNLDQSDALLKQLVEWSGLENSNSKQLAMYVFERLAECHLSNEKLLEHKDSFYAIFSKSLGDADMKVRVAALRATSSFLLTIEDDSAHDSFKTLMPAILDTVVESLKVEESLGQQALESLVDLAKTHPNFWKENCEQLVLILSHIIKNTDFEEGTRSQAAEMVMVLSTEVPATLRKIPAMKSEFVPALVQLVTECEEDMEEWAQSVDDEFGTANTVYATGVTSIERLSLNMKEKFTLEAFGPLIQQCQTGKVSADQKESNWKIKQAGYLVPGLIAEACKDSLKANLDEAIKTACAGVEDDSPRVRFASLICLGSFLTHLKPLPQEKFHNQLVPHLLKITEEEKCLKIVTQSIYCLNSFAAGLIQEDDAEIEETKKSGEVMMLYADQLLTSLTNNLKKAIQENYEPMQEQVLNLLNVTASLIEEKFATYFPHFMPLLNEILENVEAKDMQKMQLRARAIESMGVLIASVSEERQFLPQVQKVTESLLTLLNKTQFALDDPQQHAIKDTLVKTSFFLKEEFQVVANQFMPLLLKDAQLEIKIDMTDASLPSTGPVQGTNQFDIKVRGMENTNRLTLNTSDLELKINAFNHILTISEAMGEGFDPYVDSVYNVISKHMTFYSKTVRKSALKTFQHLLTAKGETSNQKYFIDKVFDLFALNILSANAKGAAKDRKMLFKELYHCMRVISQNEQQNNRFCFMDEKKLETFVKLMGQCLATVDQEKEQQMQVIEEKSKLG